MEKSENFVAIDLGTSKVVTLVGRKAADGKAEILSCSIHDSLSGIVRGEIKNIEQVSLALKETIDNIEKESGISIRQAWVGISGQHIKTLRHSGYIFIENNDGEVRQRDVQRLNDSMNNIQLPLGETILHILPQEYRLDDEPDVREPVGMIGNKLEASFHIVTSDKATVGLVDKTLAKHNITVSGRVLTPLAAAEAVLIPDEKELGVCLVDIGGGTTSLCIYHDNIIRHTGIIPLGGNIINKDIRSYGILERKVESLKVKFGGAVGAMEQADKFITIPGLSARDPKEISCRNLASIIEARLLDIIDSVNHEIKRAGYENRLGAGIVLTGGTALTRNIDVLFKNHTGYDVRVAIPDPYVTDESLELVHSPIYSVAVGLLLKALGLGDKPRGAAARPLVQSATATVQRSGQPLEERTKPKTDPEETKTSPRRWSELADTRRNEAKEPPFEPEEEEPEVEKPKKGGFFFRIKERLTNTFDVIDEDIE
ncbi:MAG: cell division protein FtsA [Rikenellaceae bacterium]|nr:cell division protein FtsA [Rikenellaceae bacterium]